MRLVFRAAKFFCGGQKNGLDNILRERFIAVAEHQRETKEPRAVTLVKRAKGRLLAARRARRKPARFIIERGCSGLSSGGFHGGWQWLLPDEQWHGGG